MRIAGISVYADAPVLDLYELEKAGLLESSARELEASGFGHCAISKATASDMAVQVCQEILDATGTAPEEVDLLINCAALGRNTLVPTPSKSSKRNLDLFKFSAPRIQHVLGLKNAETLGMSELGCVAMLTGVWRANTIMAADGYRTALVVSADALPPDSSREVLYSVISDAACAVLLRADGPGPRLVAHAQMTRGFYWNCDDNYNELLAAYYPTGRRLVHNLLREQGLRIDDIDLVVPTNVSRKSWEILSKLLGLPMERVFTENIAKKAHSIATDNYANLRDVIEQANLASGSKLLLFGFGLGAHWACSLLEV